MEPSKRITKQHHMSIKRSYGVENLHFYFASGRYCCRYIPDPEDFDTSMAMENHELTVLLYALSIGQGKVWFEDYNQYCTGMNGIKELYLPMKLGGI